MPNFKARSPQLGYRREDRNLVAVRHLSEEFGLEVDDRDAGKIKDLAHLRLGQTGRALHQQYATPVEIFDEAGMEDDARRIAVSPFDDNIPTVDEKLARHEIRHLDLIGHLSLRKYDCL